jgi:hypothetical protein
VSFEEARGAVEAFLAAVKEAQHVGADFDDVLRHASELLDIIDAELADVDRDAHAELFAAAPVLRQKLDRLRDELRGGVAH